MSVAKRVARYYVDANAAVADWRALLEEFRTVFVFERGNLFRPLEDESPDEPSRYCVGKNCGNLAGNALAASVREFTRAVHRVGEHVSFVHMTRVDLELLEQWAREIEFTFAFTTSSEKLVDLTLRVRLSCDTFAEGVECDSAVAAVVRGELVIKPPEAETVGTQIERLPPKQRNGWSDDGGDSKPVVKQDGPDASRMMFVLAGNEFGPFTPTQFDVVQIMWEKRESAWSESNAFFTFHEKWNWSQANGGPFGRHQTTIQSVFKQRGFGLPWKRFRGVFVWCGLVAPKAKPPTKPKVSRSKKR
jgi:hypothetical protein